MDFTEKARLVNRTQIIMNDASIILGRPQPKIKIEFSKSMTATFAKAMSVKIGQKWIPESIRYSEVLFPLLGKAEQTETIVHEVCHIFAGHEDAHGKIWHRFMFLMGYSAAHRLVDSNDIAPQHLTTYRTIRSSRRTKNPPKILAE